MDTCEDSLDDQDKTVEQTQKQEAARARRQAALEKILALNLPVSDWEEMEEEIIAGAIE
jgi:hypothetical protein